MIIAALHGVVGGLDEILAALAGLALLLVLTLRFSRAKTEQDAERPD